MIRTLLSQKSKVPDFIRLQARAQARKAVRMVGGDCHVAIFTRLRGGGCWDQRRFGKKQAALVVPKVCAPSGFPCHASSRCVTTGQLIASKTLGASMTFS
jgi:hypothetical protein